MENALYPNVTAGAITIKFTCDGKKLLDANSVGIYVNTKRH